MKGLTSLSNTDHVMARHDSRDAISLDWGWILIATESNIFQDDGMQATIIELRKM